MRSVSLTPVPVSGVSAEQYRWLFLLEQDIESVMIAYMHYHEAKLAIRNPVPFGMSVVGPGELIHYAKVFVCAMRRVARVLEAICANRSVFPESVGDDIRTAWRKRRKMLERYRGARDAIEHIDSEVSGRDAWQILNLEGDTLRVTEGVGAEISKKNVSSVVGAWNEIVWSIFRHMSVVGGGDD